MQIKKDKAKGLGKNASMTGTARLLQRHPQTTPALGLTIDWTSLKTISSHYTWFE
jgi:hypothetical protein